MNVLARVCSSLVVASVLAGCSGSSEPPKADPKQTQENQDMMKKFDKSKK